MKNYQLLLFLLLALLFNACRSDEFVELPETNPIPTEIPISVTGNLNGLVVDGDQNGISDAVVELGNMSTTTDENGVFIFENTTALSTGSLVRITKAGFFDGFKFTTFEPGQHSILKVEMVTKTLLASYPSSEELTVSVNGAQLHLPKNITTRMDGSPYNGEVEVRAHWYDPTDERIISSMPGDLRGINTSGETVQLTTYGMMAVELTDELGEELILKEGMKASLTFPIPQNANGPEKIPMWHLDEETGVWLEEGLATKNGDNMVAEVSHFSFWNCDDPFEVVNLSGRIITRPGANPVSGLQIVITDNDQMISGYGYTNNDGVFSGQVPSGNDLSMSIFNCGELIAFTNLGVLTEDTNLPNIPLQLENQLELSASLIDCEGNPINEGKALISTDNSLDLIVANQGRINHIMSPCSAGQGTFQGLDIRNLEVSEEINFDLESTFVNLDDVEVCKGTLTEEIIFTIGATVAQLNDAIVSIVDETYIHILAEVEGSNPLEVVEMLYYIEGVEPFPSNLFTTQNRIAMAGVTNSGFSITSTAYDHSGWMRSGGNEIGDEIIGTFDNGTISVVYKLKIDRIVKTAAVTGNIWIDTDQDGIRDNSENDPLPNDIRIGPITSTQKGLNYYYATWELESDGSYRVKGLTDGIETRLAVSYNPNATWVITSYQQGNDDTLDSDFNTSGIFETDVLILEPEETLPNIGLGIY